QVGISKISIPGLLIGKKISLRYRVYKEGDETVVRLDASQTKKGHKLDVRHNRMITFKNVDEEKLDYLEKDCISFLVFMDQEDTEAPQHETEPPNQPDERSEIHRGSLGVLQSIDEKVRLPNQKIVQDKTPTNMHRNEEELKNLLEKWSKVTPSPNAFTELLMDIQSICEASSSCPESHPISDVDVSKGEFRKDDDQLMKPGNSKLKIPLKFSKDLFKGSKHKKA
uniref:Reverse transcriptase domain-containing protein n=1 Tax=Mesocestoides corti TaxID=53468 RepID=A0A5K3EP23_MESCO